MAGEEPEAEASTIDHSTRAAELVSLFRKLNARPSDQNLAEAWAAVFAVPAVSARFFECVASIIDSIDRLRGEIDTSSLRPASKETYIGAVNVLYQFVQIGTLQSWIVAHFERQAQCLTTLELLDDVLVPLGNRAVSEEIRLEWAGRLTNLVASASEIEALPLRAFVVQHLSNVVWAIQNYDTLGIDGLSRAHGAMMAEIARAQGMAGADKPEAMAWFTKSKKVIIGLGVAIAASSAVVQQADNLLTHGEHLYERIEDQRDAAGAVGRSNGAEHGTKG